MAALWCGLRARQSAMPWRWGVAMGCLFGFLANVRFNGAFAAGAVLVWCTWMIPDRRRALMFTGTVVLSALPWAALWLWYNWARTGDAFLSPYAANFALMRKDLGMDTSWHFSYVRWAWMLVGLDNGAIWFALPLLFLPALRFRGSRPTGRGLLALLMLGALLLHAVLLSGFYAGVGVQGAGSPRYLGHQLILFGPLVWVALRRAWLNKTRLARAGIAAVLVVSCGLQLSARLLNPELEASQDVNAEHAGVPHPKPELHLPRRFNNLRLAFLGKLEEQTYPGFAQIDPVTKSRHTMLVITPAYIAFLDKHFKPAPGDLRSVFYWGWFGAALTFVACAGLLMRWTRRCVARPSR
jgi:4-amino-4-deoxy-L-arabinose transferase-like glycosyltransferase